MNTLRYQPVNKLRVVTAASLFDGHDAAINIMRRILQSQGCEVIHLGHNRSVDDVVTAALQEDVQGIAISSYQGGHVEYFKYMVDMLRDLGAPHIRIIVGGGPVQPTDRSPLFGIPSMRTDFLDSVAASASVLLNLLGGNPLVEAVRKGNIPFWTGPVDPSSEDDDYRHPGKP